MERNRSVLEEAPCGYISIKADGSILDINQTLLNWVGYTKAEVTGRKKLQDFISKGANLYFQMYVYPLIKMQGQVREISVDLISASQGKISCLFNAGVALNEHGGMESIQGIFFNITSRKTYEEELFRAKTIAEEEKNRFRFLANTVPHVVLTANSAGEIDFVNDRFHEYFGIKEEKLRLITLKNLFFADDFRPTLTVWRRLLSEKKEMQFELRLKGIQKGVHWFLVRFIPITHQSDFTTIWLGSCTDITTQKENHNLALQKLNVRLADTSFASEKKTEILKNVAFAQAHLVRSPLAKILGLVSHLNDANIDEETKFILSELRKGANELDQVITDVIQQSSLENSTTVDCY
jgi:PAS domain S-box-containing protein